VGGFATLPTRPLVVLPASVGLLSLVMAVALCLRLPALPPDGVSGTLPLVPGHKLVFTYWTHDLAFSPTVTTGGLTRQTPGPLRITIWYQHPPAAKQERLAVLKVRAWPLVLSSVVMELAAVWLWLEHATTPRSSGKSG